MSDPRRVKLTNERVRQLEPPPTGEATLWDTEVLGLGVRCLSTGVKSYIVVYRAGHGRAGTARRVTLGKVQGLRLEDARDAALDLRARVLRGEDPAMELRIARTAPKVEVVTLSAALAKYVADLARRGVANRSQVESALRRSLLGEGTGDKSAAVGDIDLACVTRRSVVRAVEALEDAGKAAAAKALRGHASTFLKWCADRGMIESNPLQGYRAPRATKAQRVERSGRDLPDSDLAMVWHACEAPGVNPAFRLLIRALVLSGQRKTETSRMRWSDLDLTAGLWRIPASETKNGQAHEVPLSDMLRQVIAAAPKRDGCEWVFSTDGKSPISGWSKLEPKLRAAIADLAAQCDPAREVAPWTLHDLRRTFRSGLTRLGVDPDVAEIMLNHRPATLRAVYDREPRLDARKDAAERWALHVAAVIDPDGRENVVPLRSST